MAPEIYPNGNEPAKYPPTGFMLGQIFERTKAQGESLEQLHEKLDKWAREGCPTGVTNRQAILELQNWRAQVHALVRKSMVVVLGASVGSAGIASALTKLLTWWNAIGPATGVN